MLVGSVASGSIATQTYSVARNVARPAATTAGTLFGVTLSGFGSASSGTTGFLATLLGNAGSAAGLGNAGSAGGTWTSAASTAIPAQPFDIPGLNSQVSAFQSSLSAGAAGPLSPTTLDPWLVASGDSQVSAFANRLSGFASGLANSGATPGNAAAGAAVELGVAISSAVNATYVVNTGILDLSSVARSGFDPNSAGVRAVSPSSIGFSAQAGSVSFDSTAFAAAYASDPVTTLATYNAMVGGVGAAVGSYGYFQATPSGGAQRAVTAYQSAAGLAG